MNQQRKIKPPLLMLLLLAMLIAACLISVSWGQVAVPAADVLRIVGGHVLQAPAWLQGIEQAQEAVIWHIRIPRLLVGILTGAALAMSGAVMQGLFSNPLADPGMIGVSGGASLGAVIAIALGLTSQSMFYMPLLALSGALLAVGIAVVLAMRNGKIPVMVLLLAGITVSMFMGALTSGTLLFMNEHSLREYLFWMVGGLDYRRWEHVWLAIGPVCIGGLILLACARHVNILVLGEDEARAVGMPVAKMRFLLLGVTALTTASAVCVSGSIGFVGLIVPHIMRLLVGPDHRTLIPASALAGSLFLVACDTIGRMVLTAAEIRVGIITSLFGAPYFLYLLYRMQQGGERR